MNTRIIRVTALKWILAFICCAHSSGAEEITFGPRLLCVEIVDDHDIGISGVYCQQIHSSLYRETLDPRGIPPGAAGGRAPSRGVHTVEGASGVAVVAVMGSGIEAEKSTALFVDGELVLVHPILGVKRVELSKAAIRWNWSSEMGRSIGTLKIVFGAENGQEKVKR